jgi:CRISPR system Cascade subunit CasD
MPDFLVFQLYGAMAAWGDIAVGEHRPSQGHPSKSAIMGLLAAALGIRRDEDDRHQALTQNYGVAICVQAAGEILRDYHTIQVPGGKRTYATRRDELLMDSLNLNTILSQRDYRMDAVYQVAIWGKNEALPFSLEQLIQALQQPVFALYLGRKSCPLSLPLQAKLIHSSTLQQAFEQYPLNPNTEKMDGLITCLLPKQRWLSVYWEEGLADADLGELKATMIYPRRDQVRSRSRWQFANRDEFYEAYSVEEGL